jgi:hypothetical protein
MQIQAAMNKYFLLGGKHIPKVASAFAPQQVPLAHQLIAELDGVDEMPVERLRFAMEMSPQTAIYVDKNNWNVYYFDLSFINQ